MAYRESRLAMSSGRLAALAGDCLSVAFSAAKRLVGSPASLRLPRDSRPFLFSRSRLTLLTLPGAICTYTCMSDSAASVASLADGVRPPTASIREPAPPSGVAEYDQSLRRARLPLPTTTTRPTALIRPHLRPVAWRGIGVRGGFSTDHPYVRRFWTAAIGPGAVADLMRLAVAAERGRSLPRPEAIGVLVREDLARWVEGQLFVRTTIPPLSTVQERRLSPELKRQHRANPEPSA